MLENNDDCVSISQVKRIKRTLEPTYNSLNTIYPSKSIVELRGYALEDRAEAIIAQGEYKKSWSLDKLSYWRQKTLQTESIQKINQVPDNYIRQRQRLYKRMMLRTYEKNQVP